MEGTTALCIVVAWEVSSALPLGVHLKESRMQNLTVYLEEKNRKRGCKSRASFWYFIGKQQESVYFPFMNSSMNVFYNLCWQKILKKARLLIWACTEAADFCRPCCLATRKCLFLSSKWAATAIPSLILIMCYLQWFDNNFVSFIHGFQSEIISSSHWCNSYSASTAISREKNNST